MYEDTNASGLSPTACDCVVRCSVHSSSLCSPISPKAVLQQPRECAVPVRDEVLSPPVAASLLGEGLDDVPEGREGFVDVGSLAKPIVGRTGAVGTLK